MKTKKLIFSLMVIGMFAICAIAQQPRPKPASKALPIVFAVLNDGKTLEPIGYIDKGKMVQAVDNATEAAKLAAFNRVFYKPASTYRLIFGGSNAGTVTIKSSDPKAECSASMAGISFASQKAKLKGNVMALATNAPATTKGSGVRRLPTAAERSEIEALVRTEFLNQKVDASAVKNLRYHNLTALDVDADGTIELVGTFWVEPGATSRSLLFFIADKGSDGKYKFGFTDFRNIEQDDVMSGEISDVDSGVYHERLLDIFDVDNDGTSEIFTYIQSFEGAGFNVYHREGSKWVNVFEGSNYHCGY